MDEYRVRKGADGGAPLRSLATTALPHFALPTTAGSSAEVMPWAGIRDEVRGEKMLFRDPLLVPDVAVLDPLLVVPTGPELTATSGTTALARAVETLYSVDRQPIADAYALQALRLLGDSLPRAIVDGEDVEARGQTQLGALLSGICADNAMVSLVHAVGHAVGGRLGLQHGIAHRILLPPVARLMLPTIGSMLPDVAAALRMPALPPDVDAAAGLVADNLAEMLDAMPIPRALREVGVAREDLRDLAEVAFHEPMISYCPRKVSVDEIEDLLAACW
jgi:alcohol dehydrogenase class IV